MYELEEEEEEKEVVVVVVLEVVVVEVEVVVVVLKVVALVQLVFHSSSSHLRNWRNSNSIKINIHSSNRNSP